MKTRSTTNRIKSRIIASYLTDDPYKMAESRVRVECARKIERIEELKAEIALYREALGEIRDLALFGRVSIHEKQLSGSMMVRSSIGNRAYEALNWANVAQEEES
jgi:hypothetical protein